MMKRAVLTICCLWLLIPLSGQTPQEALHRLTSSAALRNAAVGVSVKQVKDGKVVAAYHPQMALTPASVTKLFPTLFALKQKGAAYTYQTPVYYTGTLENGILEGDIVVEASGDPCLQSRYFPRYQLIEPLVAAIGKAGIREIRGEIRVAGAKAGYAVPGTWPWEDVSNYYAALSLPFNYRDNTCILTFSSGKAGDTVRLESVTPVIPGLRIQNHVVASARGGDNAWIYGGPYSGVWTVEGTIPQNRASFRVKGAMHRPAGVFVHELGGELKKKGISVGSESSGATGKTLLLKLVSPSLREIVFHTNKASVNLFAESLGALVAPENWPDKAVELLKEMDIAPEGITLKDACGLSPFDAVPAQVFTDLLIYAYKNAGEPFLSSLPVAGVDGGLDGYCLNMPGLKHNLKAKTGSMNGVRCLSGYLKTHRGEQLAFTLLINHYTCTTSQLQQAVRKFLSELQDL